MIASRIAGWLAAGLVLSACAAAPPTEVRLPAGTVVLDAVGDGLALAADGRGSVYVLDGDAAAVQSYTVTASREGDPNAFALVRGARYGGRGAGDGALFAPRGLDAAGLLLYVADEARGEVARFSTRGERAAPLIVPDLDPAVGVPERFDRSSTRGRPVAVASRAGTVWVADAGRGHVLRFTNDRLAGVLGGPADGDAALSRPTALALGRDGTLYVADGRRIQSFGPLGRPGAALALDFDAASVTVSDDRSDARLLVAGNADGVAMLAVGLVDGPLVATALDLGEPLRGALFGDDGFIVLTPTRLIRLAR